MERIGGDAETAGDVLVAQQRIGSDPAAELAGEGARLVDGGFGHEDYEFVAAVTGYYVGAAAILLEDVGYALKDYVAFEMAVEIVYEFEAIEVHQDDGEGAIGARGTLPFGGEGF